MIISENMQYYFTQLPILKQIYFVKKSQTYTNHMTTNLHLLLQLFIVKLDRFLCIHKELNLNLSEDSQ